MKKILPTIVDKMSETVATCALTNTGIKTGFGLKSQDVRATINLNFPVIESHPFAMSVEGRKYTGEAFMTVEPGLAVDSVPEPLFFFKGGIGYKTSLFGLCFEQKITADMSKNFDPKLEIALTYDF